MNDRADTMGIEFVHGDIFRANVEALVDPVNCVGIMGKGLAREFRRRFPGASEEYMHFCRKGGMVPGRLHISSEKGVVVIALPTKRHWRDPSYMQDIEAGLETLAKDVKRLEIKSIALPALGCGNGGLPWKDIKRVIEKHLGSLKARVLVYEPHGV